MPSASTTAKLEKQASSEASDPIRQGIVFVEHKIRNLIKKKARLDTYKEIQKSGKELDSDQKQALLKYDELNQNIVFAQDLSKQLTTIAQDNVKLQKKKEKKEAYEREQQEAAKIKEILIIQDVLANMGNDTVREDFLAGKNKAVKLTEAELQFLDELFVEVAPKREPEEGQPPFIEQAQNAAKHLLSIVEGKEKEIIGTKYSVLKEIIGKINSCGYFDHTVEEPITQQETVAEIPLPPAEPELEPEPEPQLPQVNSVPSQQFEPNAVSSVAGDVVAAAPPVMETAGLYISQRPMADVLTNVMGPVPAAFSFIQESQLESPDLGGVAPLPIPTQTFTNASFATSAAPMPMPVAVAVVPSAVYVAQSEPPAAAAAYETQQPAVQSQQFEPSSNLPSSTPQAGDGDWNDAPEQSNDWSMQAEQGSWSETPQAESNDWANDSANDGFQPAVRGGGRGRGRGGHRGGPRGERGGRGGGGYQNGRGGGGYGSQNGGRGGYNRNGEGGGGNYYQNGYQSRGDGERGGRDYNREGGQRRGGPRGGGTSDRGAPRQDRGGAPRGTGGRGGPRGRGEGRGRQ